MNRFIFRGKRCDNGEWVYGDLSTTIDGSPCINPRTYFATKYFGNDDEEDNELPKLEVGYALGEFFLVDPNTIGQCTGFKDKCGTLLYEGDLVNIGLGEIVWCELTAMFRVKWHDKTFFRVRSNHDNYRQNGEPLLLNSEIVWNRIGNIHDNKDLITVYKEIK